MSTERATETDEQIVDAFAAHLDLERGRSEHTVRAYRREAAAARWRICGRSSGSPRPSST
ncbi:site-specific integrase [Brachybacterium sp. GPGPB12]|uniref:site-specific integrase n=1 Tax=Brachybacterium sp. GPGPB12 TaxID=3023517 RepID=UPI00313430C3